MKCFALMLSCLSAARRLSIPVRLGIVILAVITVAYLSFAADPKTKLAKKTAETEEDAELKSQRREIFNYLLKKSQRRPTGTATPSKEPWVWCWEQYKANEKNRIYLYYLISDHLAIAQRRYLSSNDLLTRRKGLGMAMESARCALRRAKDIELAEKICDAYLWPHLKDADDESQSYLGKMNMMELMASIHSETKNADKCIAVYRLMIEQTNNRNTADGARLRLAQVLAKKEQYNEAIRVLEEIDDDAGVGGGKRLIPDLRAKMKAKEKN